MAICLLFTGLSFFIPEGSAARLPCIGTGIFLFMAVYSPGEGPVPFTYSAEAFPLYIRDIGMCHLQLLHAGGSTSSCPSPGLPWSIPSPSKGAVGYYAAWNVLAWVYTYFLLPETKALTLEELDTVFNVGNREHGRYYLDKLPWYVNKHILRRDVELVEPLYRLGEYVERRQSMADEKQKQEVVR